MGKLGYFIILIFLTSFLFEQVGRGRGPGKATAAARSSVYRQPGLFGYICIFPHLYIFVNTLEFVGQTMSLGSLLEVVQ